MPPRIGSRSKARIRSCTGTCGLSRSPDRPALHYVLFVLPTFTSGRISGAISSPPWSALTYDTGLGGFRTGITEEQLRDAPEFSDDSWTDRNWETRTHQHYGASPYWGAQEQRSRGTFHADNLMAFRRAARPHTGPLALWRILGIRPNTVSVCVGTADQRANWSVVLRELRR
jgi:hypothetical protein